MLSTCCVDIQLDLFSSAQDRQECRDLLQCQQRTLISDSLLATPGILPVLTVGIVVSPLIMYSGFSPNHVPVVNGYHFWTSITDLQGLFLTTDQGPCQDRLHA